MYSSPGIFNVLDGWFDVGGGGTGPFVGMVPNDSSFAARNTQVLNQIILLAQASCTTNAPYAAIILFPGHFTVPGPDSDGQDPTTSTFQGEEYFLQAPGDGVTPAISITCDNPLRFLGTGNAKLTMHIPNSSLSGDMFQINAPGNNLGGITFENLWFTYPNVGESGGIPSYCAIHTLGAGLQNGRIVRCSFTDCPIGVWFEQALECSMLQCSTFYNNNAGIAVKLGSGEDSMDSSSAKEIMITDCLFNGGNVHHGESGIQPPGSTAVWILASDRIRMANCQIDSFQNGIYISPNYYGTAIKHTFTACSINTGTDNINDMGSAVFIKPLLSNTAVSQIIFEGCIFEQGDTATPRADVPGILIDASVGLIDNIRFVSCHSLRWSGPGLQIIGGAIADGFTFPTNIEVLGGMYAGNRYHDDTYTSMNPYGIWVGVASGVRIVGVSCIGIYEWIRLGNMPMPTFNQHVGIYVDDGATDVIIADCDLRNNIDYGVQIEGGASAVIVDSCDLRGNGTNGVLIDAFTVAVTDIFVRNCNLKGYSTFNAAIAVNGSGANVSSIQVTDCAGYNDQGLQFLPTLFGGSVTVNNYSFGFFGPVEMYVIGTGTSTITSILVDTHNTHLATGSFFLMPGESAVVGWSPPAALPHVVLISK